MNATSMPTSNALQTIFTLPRTLRAAGIAQACRSLFIEFVEHTEEWSKAELVTWLARYGQLTSHANEISEKRFGHPEPRMPSSNELDPQKLQEVLNRARAYGLELLRASAQPGGGHVLASDAVIGGSVIACEERDGEHGWLPVATPGMRLEARLTSLWAVDYLLRSEEYESLMAICACGRVSFDAISRLRGGCDGHTSQISVRWNKASETFCTSYLFQDPQRGSRGAI